MWGGNSVEFITEECELKIVCMFFPQFGKAEKFLQNKHRKIFVSKFYCCCYITAKIIYNLIIVNNWKNMRFLFFMRPLYTCPSNTTSQAKRFLFYFIMPINIVYVYNIQHLYAYMLHSSRVFYHHKYIRKCPT